MDTKKGCGFAAVYHVEARESLCTINANDPRPEMGDNTARLRLLHPYSGFAKTHSSRVVTQE